MSSFYSNDQLVRFFNDLVRPSADYSFEDAFETYHKIQESEGRGGGADGLGLPALGHALAGSAGTAISKLVLYPLDLAIARLQVQRQLRGPGEAPSAAKEADVEYSDILDAARKIYDKEGGVKAFYAGCLTDISKSIVDAFLFFLAYNFLRQYHQKKHGSKSLPVTTQLSIGIAAGALSKFITTPVQQIVTRKQTAAMMAARDPTSTVPADRTDQLSIKDIALQIRSERGIRGFWAGYEASVILTLNPALTFLLHNMLKRAVLPKSRASNPGPRLTFLLAALSKAAASTITYPFSLAKTRAQVSSSSSPTSQPSGTIEAEKERSQGQETLSVQHDEAEKTGEPSYLSKPDLTTPSTQYKVSRQAKRVLRLIYAHTVHTGVFTSLATVYRTEGVLALYSGLSGEVIKGFLGHGLTMLLKERIHVLIVSLYYLVLKTAKREGGLSGGLGDIRDQAAKEVLRVQGMLGDAGERIVDGAGSVAQAAGDMAKGAGEKVGTVGVAVSEGVKGAVNGGEK